MTALLPSPAVAFVGRHNSGKTTLIVGVIAELVSRGFDVGSVKHHGHKGFSIDIPGKDSYRHRQAGASEVFVSSPGMVADVRDVDGEMECAQIVDSMPGHDVVVVEGYRKSGLPTVEVMRGANPADVQVAHAFAREAAEGRALEGDAVQEARSTHGPHAGEEALGEPMPGSDTVAVATDIPEAARAARACGLPVLDMNDAAQVADFVERRFCRERLTVAIQAGGESKRMGQSKALVPFGGRPLIDWMVRRMAPVADSVEVTTNEPERLEFLLRDHPDLHIGLHKDVLPERGALEGLLTAFTYAPDPRVAVVACDMVNASPRLVRAEYQTMSEGGFDAVIPTNKHGFEPFHALYARDACREAAKACVAAGDKRAQALFKRVNTRHFTQQEVLAAEPMGGCFVNVNTPEELHRLEKDILAD